MLRFGCVVICCLNFKTCVWLFDDRSYLLVKLAIIADKWSSVDTISLWVYVRINSSQYKWAHWWRRLCPGNTINPWISPICKLWNEFELEVLCMRIEEYSSNWKSSGNVCIKLKHLMFKIPNWMSQDTWLKL